MKLALSALFLLGLFKLSSADPDYTTLRVIVQPSEDGISGNEICINTPGCDGEYCSGFHIPAGTIKRIFDEKHCQRIIPYVDRSQPGYLDKLYIPYTNTLVPCSFVEETSEGKAFDCVIPLPETTITATTATTDITSTLR